MDCFVSLPDSSRRSDGDLISQLPDSILHYILSFLSTKDAIRTSALSKRWKFLWTYLYDFDLEHPFRSERNCIYNQVDRILQQVECIKRLRIEAHRDPLDLEQVKSWISALLKFKVEELYLSLHVRCSFVLPSNLSVPESLNLLHLRFPYGFEIPSSIHFSGLKTLTLSRATFSNETSAQQLFLSCPVLQNLILCSCNWNISNDSIKIPTLTTLCINKADYVQDDSLLICKVVIDTVNLVSLSLKNYMRLEFVPINLTSLVEADIDCKAIKLLNGISHVKSLKISDYWILCHARDLLSRLPTFHNLTRICVHVQTSNFINRPLLDISEKSPKLEVLDVIAGSLPDIVWTIRSRVPHCIKHSLKFFSISRFDGSLGQSLLVKSVVKHAAFLERIDIFCSSRFSVKKQVKLCNYWQEMRSGFNFASCKIEFQTISDSILQNVEG